MPNFAPSEARVKALIPRPSAYDIRDRKLKGSGVRVLPSGARRLFIHTQHRGQRTWKIVGDANAITLAEARTRAASMLAAVRCGHRPREREYTVLDTRTPGLGVRVRPSRGASFVLLHQADGRSRRKSLGSAMSRSIHTVRRQGHAVIAELYSDGKSRPG